MTLRRLLIFVARVTACVGALAVCIIALLAGEGIYATKHARARLVQPSFPAHMTAGADSPGKPLRIAFIGDSTVAGVGASHAAGWLGAQIASRVSNSLARPVEIVGFGISGAQTHDVTSIQVPRLHAADGPWDLVVIVIGGNDVTHLTTYGTIRHQTPLLVAAASRAAGGAPVVFGGSARFFDAFGVPQPLRKVFDVNSVHFAHTQRAAVAGLQAGGRNVEFVDIGRDASSRHRGDLSGMSRDGFHPSDKGYGWWGDAIAPAVITAVASPHEEATS